MPAVCASGVPDGFPRNTIPDVSAVRKGVIEYDRRRDAFLLESGFHVLRFTNVEALHLLLLSLNEFAQDSQITQEKAHDDQATKKATASRSSRAS